MKWTFEQKMVWIKAYKNGGWVPKPADFRRSQRRWHDKIRGWVHVIEKYGEDGLKHHSPRAFTAEEKLKAVLRVEGGESLVAVGHSLGMASYSSVLSWLRAYREKGIDGLQSKPKGRRKHAQEEIAGTEEDRGAGAGEPHADPRERLLKKLEGLGGIGGAKPRQRYEAILQTKREFEEARLSELLSVAGLPKSTYFYEAKRAEFDSKNSELIERIKEVFGKSKGRYGVRRVTAELRSQRVSVNHKKVQRLMAKLGLAARRKAVHYNSYKGNVGKVADDLIITEYVRKDGQVHHKSDFSCDGPNRKWTTDVSQFTFPWGKCYLSPIKDMYDGRIVAYDLSLHPDLSQTKRMLDAAFSLGYDLKGLIFHSDQGWQYQHGWYVESLKRRGILQSMSRKGNCLDNCIMESFFGTMKSEMFYGHEGEFATFEEFASAVKSYIDWYNNERIRYNRYTKKWMPPQTCFDSSFGGHPCGASL